jgi:hypothetical protein
MVGSRPIVNGDAIFLLVVVEGTTGARLVDSQWMLWLWAAGEKMAEDPPVHARLI